MHRALNQIGVAREVLRHAVDDQIRAELERLLEERRRKRVVDDDERAGACAIRAIAAMSYTSRRGFVGDSSHTSASSGVIARSSAVEIAEIHLRHHGSRCGSNTLCSIRNVPP